MKTYIPAGKGVIPKGASDIEIQPLSDTLGNLTFKIDGNTHQLLFIEIKKIKT